MCVCVGGVERGREVTGVAERTEMHSPNTVSQLLYIPACSPQCCSESTPDIDSNEDEPVVPNSEAYTLSCLKT